MKWRAVGFVSVVLAVTLLLAYVNHDHRTRVSGYTRIEWVLVAKQRIPKGTPGWIVETNGMYQATTLPPKEEREVGAIADPQYPSGRAAAIDIFPGQQLTETNFTACPTPCRP